MVCLRFEVLGFGLGLVVVSGVGSGEGSEEELEEELEKEMLFEGLFGASLVGEVGWRVTLESVDVFEDGSTGLGGTGFSEGCFFAFGLFFRGLLVVFEDFVSFCASDSLPDDDDEEGEGDDELDEDAFDGDFATIKFAPSDSSSLSASLSDVCGELDDDRALTVFGKGFWGASVPSISSSLSSSSLLSLLLPLLLVSSVLTITSLATFRLLFADLAGLESSSSLSLLVISS